MKTLNLITAAAILTFSHVSNGQGTFQNLNFERANPTPAGPQFTVTAASAFPDWTIYSGTVQQTEVFQNDYTLGQAGADIFGPNQPGPGLPTGAPGIIDGNYTAVLQGGTQAGGGALVSTFLEQTGLIPAGDQSLDFKAWQQIPDTLGVSFGGNDLPLVILGTGANYTLYGVDISAYAGQTGTLTFTAFQPSSGLSFLELDDITFSTSSVPEPGSYILTSLGGLLFALHRRFALSRR